MLKQLFMASLCLMGAMTTYAQSPLPVNPKVKTGVLANGLTYYIMHNEEPKERANFYIAQKVGSTLEAPDQLGLAHFLEHMAFNGTSHYPGKDMLNYLQSKGIRFGADINAYTSFDETVYNINNVPTTDVNLMDSVLLVLHDWSCDILLEDSEIDAERGVIQEEWRSRNNAQYRMYADILPKIYKEYQYQQMPIGKMDIVMNFKPEVLRAYYKKWYRPDQQGIIIVGDFDADVMEKKVKDLFSTIVMPENAAPREYPTVSDNENPIFVSFSDPELTQMLSTISFKSEKMPVAMRNTVEGYVGEYILKQLLTQMFNTRLSEFALTPECNYAYAGVYFSDFYVSKTKDSFNVGVLAKNNPEKAIADAMAVVTRACKTGFTESEYERASQNLMASMDKSLAEKDKTNNDSFGRELCSLFTDNNPAPGIEMEHMIWSQVLPNLPVMALNQAAAGLLTDNNIVVVTSAPKAEGVMLATEEGTLSTLAQVMHAEYEALEDEKITDPLIAELPAPGTIVSETPDNKLGTTTFVLSNGAKVIVKPTDFAGDEILMTGFRNGGKTIYTKDQAANVLMMDEVFESSKMGPFDSKTLRKYLSGKNVSLGLSINAYTDMLNGNSTVKDLPTLFELIYTAFTNVNPDPETYAVNIERIRPSIANQDKNPQRIFFKHISDTRYNNNPLMNSVTLETLDQADYAQSLGLIKDVLANAGEYTFVFTGNITDEVIRPLILQYIASLPSKGKAELPVNSVFSTVTGQVEDIFTQPMEVPASMVYNLYSGYNLDYNQKNDVMIELVGDILGNIYTETLREEEGGTYSPMATSTYNPNTGEWDVIYLFFTNKDQQEKLMTRAHDELMKVLKEGVSEEHFNKAKEAMIKQYEINSRKNQFWQSMLVNQERFPAVDMINGYEDTLKGVTLADFNKFLSNLYDGQNRMQVVLEGVPVNAAE